MYLKYHNFTLNDVKKLLVLRTWYASIFVLPVANRYVLYFANKTKFTPNQITIIAFGFRIITIFMFLNNYYMLGAISYYMAYTLDCIDGPVARLTGKTSNLGRYLDHVSDLVGDILILVALASSLDMLFTPMILGMIFMHLAESYISYLAGFAIEKNTGQSQFFLFKIINGYRNWWFKRNYKSFLSFPDYTAFVFILMPILNLPRQGLEIGFYLLLIIVCYTIFSTFVSIHTGEKRFP